MYVCPSLHLAPLHSPRDQQQQLLQQQQQLRVPFPGLAPPNSLMGTPSPNNPPAALGSSSSNYNPSNYAAPPSRASSHASPSSIRPLDSPQAGVFSAAAMVGVGASSSAAQSHVPGAASSSESGNFGGSSEGGNLSSSSGASPGTSAANSVMTFPRLVNNANRMRRATQLTTLRSLGLQLRATLDGPVSSACEV